jgi:hypothetical protein
MAAELPPEQRTAVLAAATGRVDEVNEASLWDTDELKWADVGHLIVRPRLAARLSLALWAELQTQRPSTRRKLRCGAVLHCEACTRRAAAKRSF